MNKAFVELESHSFQPHHLQAVNRTLAFRHAQLLTGLRSKQCFCMKFFDQRQGIINDAPGSRLFVDCEQT